MSKNEAQNGDESLFHDSYMFQRGCNLKQSTENLNDRWADEE